MLRAFLSTCKDRIVLRIAVSSALNCAPMCNLSLVDTEREQTDTTFTLIPRTSHI